MTVPAGLSAGERYAAARRSIVGLIGALDAADLTQPVPACPGWSVHDVVAHVTGVAADTVDDVSAGDDLDAWTARHVAARTSMTTAEVLAEWEQAAARFEPLLDAEQMRLPAAVLDVVTHEHDIRGAVGQPGNREDPTLLMAAQLLGRGWQHKIAAAGLAPVAIVDAPTDDAPCLAATPFELFRSAFGRRSDRQLRDRFTGVGDPAPYIELLCIFGPSPVDITE